MKRSALKRRTPLRVRAHLTSSTRLGRHTRVKPVNRKRRAKLHARNYGPQADLCRTLPCCSCGAPPPSEASHVKARGMGGCNSDDSFNAPQCRRCHDALGNEGAISFWRRVGVDPLAVIERLRAVVAQQGREAA